MKIIVSDTWLSSLFIFWMILALSLKILNLKIKVEDKNMVLLFTLYKQFFFSMIQQLYQLAT